MVIRFLLIFNLLAIGILACAPLFSKEIRGKVDQEVIFSSLVKDPQRYMGRVILLGGRIINTEVKEGKTLIEVLQQPLDWRHKPKETDESWGRFLASFADFRDPAIYSAGRKITIVGQVVGAKTLLLHEKEYQYPVLEVKESHLWEKETSGGVFFHFGIGWGGTF